jgi:ribosome-binding protein aMBF1 (putative translation factor)
MTTIMDQLRTAIDGSGMSRYAIAKAIELDQSTLSRFMSKKAGLSVATIDKLGELLGLQLTKVKKTVKAKGR